MDPAAIVVAARTVPVTTVQIAAVVSAGASEHTGALWAASAAPGATENARSGNLTVCGQAREVVEHRQRDEGAGQASMRGKDSHDCARAQDHRHRRTFGASTATAAAAAAAHLWGAYRAATTAGKRNQSSSWQPHYRSSVLRPACWP